MVLFYYDKIYVFTDKTALRKEFTVMIMKKLLCTLAAVSTVLCASAAYADGETGYVKNVELMFPHRVFLYGNEDGTSNTEATSPLKVNIDRVYTEDESLKPNTVTGRTIYYKPGLPADGGTDTEASIGSSSKMRYSPTIRTMGAYKNSYGYGLMFWKNNFTYEFDFTVNTLEDNFQFQLATTKLIQFTKDPESDQYYIKWTDPVKSISGKNLEYGKTYHLRIEADTEKGAKLFTTFTDPETDYIYTSYVNNPVSSTLAERAVGTATYIVRMRCTGETSITTSNEELYIERYFITSHELEAEEGKTSVKASTTIYNGTSDPNLKEIPYLFVGVYDSNGALAASSGIYEAPDNKLVPKLANVGTPDLSAAKYDYSTETDISGLPDGEYTVKSFIWRNPDEMIVCSQAQKKTITVENGTIAVVNN